MFPKSLSELKKTANKYTWTMIQNTFVEIPFTVNGNLGATTLAGPSYLLNVPRTVEKLQTNSLKFSAVPPKTEGSWLTFGKAKGYKFDNDLIIVDIEETGAFAKTITYKLTPI